MKKFLRIVFVLLFIALLIYFLCKEGFIDEEKLKSGCAAAWKKCPLKGGKSDDDTIFEDDYFGEE
ncbi:MAG: hypothetical protein ACOYBC_06450 [Bilifractor sp.]|jgi:hypothetical protein